MDYESFVKRYGVGLTGGIATGKSTVANLIRQMGFTVIDADDLARQAVAKDSPALAQIVQTFGGGVLHEDGTLNRRKMAEIVFTDLHNKKKLENIMHPVIHSLLKQKIESLGLMQSPQFWFYEGSLLFEAGTHKKFREVWSTLCQGGSQLERLEKRDHHPKDFARKIIASQMPAEEKARLAQFVIHTDGGIDDINRQIEAGLKRLQQVQ